MVGVAEKEVPCKIHRAQELLISISSRQKIKIERTSQYVFTDVKEKECYELLV
jgi:hypothetical protein